MEITQYLNYLAPWGFPFLGDEETCPGHSTFFQYTALAIIAAVGAAYALKKCWDRPVTPTTPNQNGDEHAPVAPTTATNTPTVSVEEEPARPSVDLADLNQALSEAAIAGDEEETFQLLRDHSKDWGIPDYDCKPLLLAARSGNVDAIQLFLGLQHDSHVTSHFGSNALHFAARSGSAEAIQALLDAGADPHATNTFGKTPLFCAARSGSAEAIQALLAAGANPNATDRLGQTPLFDAARSGDVKAIQALLDAGADPHATNTFGRTPFFDAAQSDNAEAIQAILIAGGKPKRDDLLEALEKNQAKIVSLLLDHDAPYFPEDEHAYPLIGSWKQSKMMAAMVAICASYRVV